MRTRGKPTPATIPTFDKLRQPVTPPPEWGPFSRRAAEGPRPFVSKSSSVGRLHPTTDANRQITKNMLEAGIIQKIKKRSNYLSYPFVIPKLSGELRFIVNYAHLTPLITIPSMHLPSFPSHPSSHLALRSIDFKHAFYHVQIHRKARHITAFRVDDSRYQFTRLPMGLNVSPGFLQALLQEVMAPMRQATELSWIHI